MSGTGENRAERLKRPSLEEYGLTEQLVAQIEALHAPDYNAAVGVSGPVGCLAWLGLGAAGLAAPAYLALFGTLTSLFWAPKLYRALRPDPLSLHRENYAQYKAASKAWQTAHDLDERRRKDEHWTRLDGHGFEREVARY